MPGPKQAGAPAALGKEALVVYTHRQRRRSTMCSVTTRRIWGRSKTWRCSVSTTSASSRSDPHDVHEAGAWLTTLSGSATWARCLPGAPGCLPGEGRCPTLSTGRCRGLRESFCRWRHRRVAGVPAEALFQVGQLRLEHRHLGPQQRVLGRQLLVGRSIGGGIAGRNSPPYARSSPWWWIRWSRDLNSYLDSLGVHSRTGAAVTGRCRRSLLGKLELHA